MAKQTKPKAAATESATKPPKSRVNKASQSNPNLQFVTSWNLKRLTVTDDPIHLKMILSAEDYRQVQVIGMRLGVTWDEVIRGLLGRELSGITPGDGLADFIPALQ